MLRTIDSQMTYVIFVDKLSAFPSFELVKKTTRQFAPHGISRTVYHRANQKRPINATHHSPTETSKCRPSELFRQSLSIYHYICIREEDIAPIEFDPQPSETQVSFLYLQCAAMRVLVHRRVLLDFQIISCFICDGVKTVPVRFRSDVV